MVAASRYILVPFDRVANIDEQEAVTKTPFPRHTCHDGKDESQDRARSQNIPPESRIAGSRESRLNSSKFSLHFIRKQPIRKQCSFRSLIRGINVKIIDTIIFHLQYRAQYIATTYRNNMNPPVASVTSIKDTTTNGGWRGMLVSESRSLTCLIASHLQCKHPARHPLHLISYRDALLALSHVKSAVCT